MQSHYPLHKYSMTTTKNYWCHICQRVFTKIYIEDSVIQCVNCKRYICEEIINDNPPPSEFEPFNINMNSHNDEIDNEDELEQDIIAINNSNSSIVDLILNLIRMEYEEDEIETIIDYLMQNDPNRYGTPPASKRVVDSLDNIEITKDQYLAFGIDNTCSVCKEELKVNQKAIKLPCSHYYHPDCIIPWLKEHNSCPICRNELETDDKDYEKRKQELLKHIRNNITN